MAFTRVLAHETVLYRMEGINVYNCEEWFYRKIKRIQPEEVNDLFLGHFASLVPRMFNQYVQQYWRSPN